MKKKIVVRRHALTPVFCAICRSRFIQRIQQSRGVHLLTLLHSCTHEHYRVNLSSQDTPHLHEKSNCIDWEITSDHVEPANVWYMLVHQSRVQAVFTCNSPSVKIEIIQHRQVHSAPNATGPNKNWKMKQSHITNQFCSLNTTLSANRKITI